MFQPFFLNSQVSSSTKLTGFFPSITETVEHIFLSFPYEQRIDSPERSIENTGYDEIVCERSKIKLPVDSLLRE